MPVQVLEEPQCRIRIDPNLVDKFKRLRGGINEVGTKITRDIGLRYEYDKSTGAFDILGPDTEILSLAIETLRFWIDEDVYPRSGITCQVGYPNKGIVFWRFHGDYARKFDHLFESEIENLKRIPTINVKAVPTKKNPEFVEIYCNFNTYHRVKDEIMRISSELAKICQDDFFVPISDFHKARKFARAKARDKSVLFALKEYIDSDKFRVWIFARDYTDIIRARKEWINHVGRIARDTAFEERLKLDRLQGVIHDDTSVNSAHFFGHESSKESDLLSHKQHLDQRKTHGMDFFANQVKLQRKPTQTKNSPKDKIKQKSTGTTYDNPNFPRPAHMFFPVRKHFEDDTSDENQQSEEQKENPWLDPLLIANGQAVETKHANPVTNSKWITEPIYQLYQAKKPNRPTELNRIYMHHQVHQEDSDDPKAELTLVKHPDTNLINENIITLRKSQIITAVTDHRFAPRREPKQTMGQNDNVSKKTAQQMGSLRQNPSLHSVKQMKHREAQSNIRYHINVNGLDIFMYRHNVVKLNNMDALVNVVDNSIQKGGFIARDMAASAGKQVDDEIKVFLFNNGPLKVAETCVTSAGKIPCLGIINVAGPKWSDYETVEEKCAIDLHTAIYNTLKTAEKHKYRKIGLPTICSETYFGIPKEIVAEVHVKALVDYSLGMGPLYPVLEIHLVDLDVDMLYAIKQAYEDWASSPGFFDMAEKYKSATGVIPNPMKELSQRAQSAVSLKGVPSHRSKNVVTFTEQSYTNEGHQVWSFDILKKLTVHVYMGSVVKLNNVDAIVCGVDRKMKGTLAKLIRTYGGHQYELALSQARGQRSLVEGEVVVCTAGNLPVKWVFHSIILQPMRKASLKNLSRLDSIYTQILHAADKLDITSLAMPLIGAGRLREKFEIEQCSLKLIDNIIELCLSTGQDLKLKEIHLVNVSELNTQYLCQALRTRAHTKLRVENEDQPPSRQEMFSTQDQTNSSTNAHHHHHRRSKPKTQNHPESPKRISPIQKRHGRILYDKNALFEEQFKRRIRDLEEEKRAAMKRNRQEFSDEQNISYSPRKVNNWLQSMNGVAGAPRQPANGYQENYLYGSLPNGFIQHEQKVIERRRKDEVPKHPIKVKSRAESYHTYNRDDQMASHREKWDLVRQRSQSTDALPRKKESKYKEEQLTNRSEKDVLDIYDNKQKQLFPAINSNSLRYADDYDVRENDERDLRFYSDYERSPRRHIDTYESLVTEREARESDYQLYRNRDDSRFRTHRDIAVNPVYDNAFESDGKSKSQRRKHAGLKDINDEVERILKEREKDQRYSMHMHERDENQREQEKTYKEKERDEIRQVQKYWAINDEFQKDLQTVQPSLTDSKRKVSVSKERLDQKKTENTATDKEKELQNEKVEEISTANKANFMKTKPTKENKETKKTRIKYENRIFIDSSKHKSKKKDSKKAKRLPSKTSSATRVTGETLDSLNETEIPVDDRKTDVTTTYSGTSSPMKRYDSLIDKRYRQFDKYTNSDVYPRTPEPSLTQENLDGTRKSEESGKQRTGKAYDRIGSNKNDSAQSNKKNDAYYDDEKHVTDHSKSVKSFSSRPTIDSRTLKSNKKNDADNDAGDLVTDQSKSVKSFSSRPTIDSRVMKVPNKEGDETGKTFSVLAGDVGMMEQFQTLSGRLRNYNVPVQVN